MRIRSLFALIVGVLSASDHAFGAESGFTTYGLGSAAFGAGVTPPPGTYISVASGFYQGEISGAVTYGGLTFDVGMEAEFFSQSVVGLYVPDRKVLGGNLGLTVIVPVGHVDLVAQVTGPLNNTIEEETSGWGLGDMNLRAQLGWERGDFAHTAYVQVVIPTGRYDTGFQPSIGLNRPGVDIGWAFTWTEKISKLQFNGAAGVTFNFENEATDYLSGSDFHFEWAVGREVCEGLVVGVVGYDYRQLTGDSGPGATLGPFEGDVDAVGAGLSYTTLIGKTPLIIDARHYEEYNTKRRFEGSMSILSGTVRF